MNVSWAMSGIRSTSRTIRPISRSMRRWYLTTSISNALTSPRLTRSISGASASGAFILGVLIDRRVHASVVAGDGSRAIYRTPYRMPAVLETAALDGQPAESAVPRSVVVFEAQQHPAAQIERHCEAPAPGFG